jgi:hypothetical protein
VALRAAGQEAFADELEGLAKALDGLEKVLAAPRGETESRLGAFQQRLLTDLWEKLAMLREAAPREPVRLADLPNSLKLRFIGASGRFAMYVSPREDIWDRGFLRRFIGELQAVDADVTGAPVLIYEVPEQMVEGYRRAALYAAIVITLVVLVDFRSPAVALFAFVPLVLGFIWMVGFMGAAGLRFNLANLVALPLILGIAIASGIHMIHRFRQEGDMILAAGGTGRAVVLSLLTTAMGFGSMGVARYRGISSLGQVLAIGVLASMFSAVIVLPLLMHYLMPPNEQRHPLVEASGEGESPAD